LPIGGPARASGYKSIDGGHGKRREKGACLEIPRKETPALAGEPAQKP